MQIINGKEIFTTVDELVEPRHSALVLIDFQNDYIIPGGYADKVGWDCSMVREIVPRTKDLLETISRKGMLIIYIQMTSYPHHLTEAPSTIRSRMLRTGAKFDGTVTEVPMPCIENTSGWNIIADLSPAVNNLTMKKHRASSFAGTNLDLALRSNRIKTVLLTGLVTSGCVMATAFDTESYGYYPVLVSDCVADHKKNAHDNALSLLTGKMDTIESGQLKKIWSKA